MASILGTKDKYLTYYDYGMGGVYHYIYARSTDEILQKYPPLMIVEHDPAWMTADIQSRIGIADIDDPPNEFLKKILEEQ